MGTFHEDTTAKLIHGNALDLSQHIEPESVDLIITSPPYFALRSYKDGDEHYAGQIGDEPTPQQFLEALWTVTAECQKVLKPGGNLFVNLGDKYAGSGGNNQSGIGGQKRGPSAYNQSSDVRTKSLMGLPWRYALGCIDGAAGDLWILRAEIVWSKPNGLPESVTDRVRRSHETWFHFTRTQTSFACIDEIREAHARLWDASKKNGNTGTGNHLLEMKDAGHAGHTGMQSTEPNPMGRVPGSVWEIATEPLRVPEWLGVEHFAAFPQEWPRRIIKGWSPTGFCVECGQPRTPIKSDVGEREQERDYQPHLGGRATPSQWKNGTNPNPRWVIGYACACDDTNAPTTPAVVLDPFCGTGTVPMVARALGRYGIGVDLSQDYLKLAKWRVWDSGHATKSIRRNNLEAQTQLFGDI